MGTGLAGLLVENIAVPSDAGPPTVPDGNEAAIPFTSTIVRRQDTKGGSVSPLFMAEREVLMLRLNAKRDVRVSGWRRSKMLMSERCRRSSWGEWSPTVKVGC